MEKRENIPCTEVLSLNHDLWKCASYSVSNGAIWQRAEISAYKHAIAAYDTAKTGIPSQIGELIAPNS